MTSDVFKKHFPDLSNDQIEQLKGFGEVIEYWNDKINVISRKDIDNIFPHHILHSLFIKKVIQFKDGAKVLDVGTGGGFPGIPLAICFPNVKFHLVDARAKKIMVVQEVIDHLKLKNVVAEHKVVQEVKTQYDFVVTRAVAKIETLMGWCRPRISPEHIHSIPNGVIALKGGTIRDLKNEVPKGEYAEQHAISDWTDIEHYSEKYVIYIQA
ncbi:UNVERIFIED_CONTAM: hypothetical protein GTU68_029903 [Idotea baltica]|nr:hypothetical protein [Idotea baltica]